MKLKNLFFPILALIILTFFILNLQNFKLDASSDTLILQNDKDFKFFNYYNDVFKSKNFLVLAIKYQKIIDRNYIQKINEIKNKLLEIEEIESIFSIVDAPILLSNNINLSNLKNNIETINNTQINLEIILEEFIESPLYSNQIISKDKKLSAMIIYLKKDLDFNDIKTKRNNYLLNKEIDNKELNKINQKYKKLKEVNNIKRNKLIYKIRNDLNTLIKNDNESINDYSYFLGGIDMIIDDTITFIKKDILTFAIAVFIFIFFILFLIFRNLKWVFIPIISTSYAIISMIGLIGFLKWEVTAISSNFISLMLILSISMCVHIINNYRFNYNNKIVNPINTTMYKMFWPCFYTALTTIVAFSSLLFSDIKPVIDFGKIMIIALSIIFITSFTILPLLISFFPKIENKQNIKFRILDLFYNYAVNNSIKIYSINIIIFLISLYGINKLNVENSFINYFKKDTEIHKGMKIIDQKLGGTTPIDIIIKFHDENKIIDNNIIINDDEDLILDDLDLEDDLFDENISNIWFTDEKINTIKTVHKYLESKNEIGKVQSLYSLIDMAEQINSKELNTFELSILYKEVPEDYKNDLLSPYLSIENNMIKISARVKDSDKIKRKELIEDIELFLNSNDSSFEKSYVNGLLVLYNNMLQSLFSSQIKSFGLVLFAIFIMFIILFKSFYLSIIGIIPNIFACTFILGIMGILKIPLDIMTITIAAITIGIAVDNTIHYLYKTKMNAESNMDIKDVLKDSHDTVGQAVLTTSLTIAFGFSVLCLSNFVPTVLFGMFTGLAMIIAMLGVLITLPSGLLKYKNKS